VRILSSFPIKSLRRQPLSFLKLEAPVVGSDIHVNRSADITSGYWDDPVDKLEDGAFDLRFIHQRVG